MTADLPVERKIRQPWFYGHKFPDWIFDYVLKPEDRKPVAKS